MTNAQLEAIFKANIGKSLATALDAVYTQGWYSGAAASVPAGGNVGGKAASDTKPTTIVNIPHRG